MPKSPSVRHRLIFRLLALAIGTLTLPASARADLLVNDLGDRAAAPGLAPQAPGQVAPPVAICPFGPAVVPAREARSANLLTLLGVCFLPPISEPTPPPGDGGVISGTGGGGGSTPVAPITPVTPIGPINPGGPVIASVSPEPGSLLIGLIGAGAASLASLVRRRRLTLLA
jgi:hypothetical protein